MTAFGIARELWWMNQDFSLDDIILTWFSMLIYHLEDEQEVCWWPRFRDTVSLRDMIIISSWIRCQQ
jgi:hypothetical protein